jgi:hypothetical protein
MLSDPADLTIEWTAGDVDLVLPVASAGGVAAEMTASIDDELDDFDDDDFDDEFDDDFEEDWDDDFESEGDGAEVEADEGDDWQEGVGVDADDED